MRYNVRSHWKTHVRVLTACFALIASTILAVSATSPNDAVAQEVAERVIVFENEFTPLTAFDDIESCNNAPPLAHTIMNLTSRPITLYADDICGVPLVELGPNFGSHVAPGQSSSATD